MNNPIITSMDVVPVAGYDSMLMTLSGAHAPWFTRNIVILKDSDGHTGLGEIHGGDYTHDALVACEPLVVGKPVLKYRNIMDAIRKSTTRSSQDDGEGIQRLDISKLKYVVKSEWAIECALLDLAGQVLDLPMCDLLGNGRQRDAVEVLGYLFYVSDKEKAADLPYVDESDSEDPWFAMRRREMLKHEDIVAQAVCLQKKYGFRSFKLKGGVFPGAYEMDTVRALKESLPEAHINIDPNGAWSLAEAISLCKPMENVLSYIEDPTGPEAGFSSREVMAEFKNAVRLPVATNMIATDWRQLYHALALKSVDIVLADPHFWGFRGTVELAGMLKDWGLIWGSHSNNHFDITLAAFAQVGCAVPGNPTPMDTHWIWQDGQDLLLDAPKIVNGFLQCPVGPGLGVHLNEKRLQEAHELYMSLPYHDRNDALAMQYLIPDWKYDSKKPCLVR